MRTWAVEIGGDESKSDEKVAARAPVKVGSPARLAFPARRTGRRVRCRTEPAARRNGAIADQIRLYAEAHARPHARTTRTSPCEREWQRATLSLSNELACRSGDSEAQLPHQHATSVSNKTHENTPPCAPLMCGERPPRVAVTLPSRGPPWRLRSGPGGPAPYPKKRSRPWGAPLLGFVSKRGHLL